MKRLLKETCGCCCDISVIHTVQKKFKLTGTISALIDLSWPISEQDETRKVQDCLFLACYKMKREVEDIYTAFEPGTSFCLPQSQEESCEPELLHRISRKYCTILVENRVLSHDKETDTYTLLEKIPIENLVISIEIKNLAEITREDLETAGIKMLPVRKFSRYFVLTAEGEFLRLPPEKIEPFLWHFQDTESLASDSEEILETYELRRMLAKTVIAIIKDGSDLFEDIRERMKEKSAELFGMEFQLSSDELLEFLEDMERSLFIEINNWVFRVKRDMTD